MANNISNYIFRISNIKYFSNIKKNSYLRFRINYSWVVASSDQRGEYAFNHVLKDYTNDPMVSCYSVFIKSTENKKIEEFFEKYNAKLLITYSNNIAGIKFENPKYKELFWLRYSEYFPDTTIIK